MIIDIRQLGDIESFYMGFDPPESEEDGITTEDLKSIDKSDECKNCESMGTAWCELCDAQ